MELKQQNILVKMKFGSHLYGLATERSDTDYKGIYLPSKEDILLQRVKKSINISTGNSNTKNSKEDIDTEFYSLQYFLGLAISGDTTTIDMLHCPQGWEEISSPIWEDLKSKRHLFYTKNLKSFLGYCKNQAHRYSLRGSRLDTAEKVIKWCNKVIEKNKVTSSITFKEYLKLIGCKKDPNTALEEISGIYKSYEEAKKSGKTNTKGLRLSLCKKEMEELLQLPYVTKEEVGEHNDLYELITDDSKCFLKIFDKRFGYTCYVENILASITTFYKNFGERAELARQNLNIDWKAISHCLRAGYQLKEILETKDLKYPLKDREFLLKVKQGRCNWVDDGISDTIESVIEEVGYLTETSSFPETVDREYWDKWLLGALEENLK